MRYFSLFFNFFLPCLMLSYTNFPISSFTIPSGAVAGGAVAGGAVAGGAMAPPPIVETRRKIVNVVGNCQSCRREGGGEI